MKKGRKNAGWKGWMAASLGARELGGKCNGRANV